MKFAWPISCDSQIIRGLARVTFRACHQLNVTRVFHLSYAFASRSHWLFSPVATSVIFSLITRVWFQIFVNITDVPFVVVVVVGEIQRFTCFIQIRFWEGRSHFILQFRELVFVNIAKRFLHFVSRNFMRLKLLLSQNWGLWIPTFVIWFVGGIIMIFSRLLVSMRMPKPCKETHCSPKRASSFVLEKVQSNL